jgi:hypothetical protein
LAAGRSQWSLIEWVVDGVADRDRRHRAFAAAWAKEARTCVHWLEEVAGIPGHRAS